MPPYYRGLPLHRGKKGWGIFIEYLAGKLVELHDGNPEWKP